MGDNFSVRVVSRGKEHLSAAVKLGWSNCPGGKATHYLSPIPERKCSKCCGSKTSGVWTQEGYVRFPCQQCQGTGIITKQEGMILFWNEDNSLATKPSPLPFPLSVDSAVDFLWGWLETAKYGPQPDHDGDNKEGFIVTTGDFWGHVEDSHYAFLGVYPDWQMYGK